MTQGSAERAHERGTSEARSVAERAELAERASGSAGRRYGRGLRTDEYPQHRHRGTPTTTVGELPRPKRRVRDFRLIAVVVAGLMAVVVATYLIADPLGGPGADTPDQAVDGFLAGIYEDRDPEIAGSFVCDSARDESELEQIVFQVSQYEEAYTGARTTWSYPPITVEGRRAVADVTLTVTTANEQAATRAVTLVLVDDGGWLVCDIRTL